MMELKRLDGFGQVASADYLATDAEVDEALENAFEQASQGWGVRREVGVYLTLVRELRISLSLAGKADEALRKVKGLQLELGRTKKALGVCAEELDEHNDTLGRANRHIKTLEERVETLTDAE